MYTKSPTTAKPMSGEKAETCEDDEIPGFSRYGPDPEDREEEDDEEMFNQNDDGEIQSWILEEYINKHPTKEQDKERVQKEAETSDEDYDDDNDSIPGILPRGDPDLSDDKDDDTITPIEGITPSQLIRNPYAKAKNTTLQKPTRKTKIHVQQNIKF
jgi:hypothetical protein